MKTGTATVTSLHVQANRFDLLSRLADDLAHEIKNPVHAAVINLELLRRRISAGESGAAIERAATVEQEVVRALELTDWLLQLIRPERDPARVVDLDRVVADLLPGLEVLGRIARVRLHYEPAEHGALIPVERTPLRHALLNLVANALEAMRPDGGRLDLVATRTAEEVQLRVRDTGGGVAADAVDRLGAVGFTTRSGRAGLGLAVAHALMEEAGGRVALETTGGHARGATFLLALPRASGA